MRSTTDRDLGSGLAYALQAYEGSRMFGDEYDEAIGAALEAAMYPETFSQIGSLRDDGIVHRGARLSNDGKYITCRESNNSLQVYSSVTGERLYIIRDFGWFGNTALDITPDSKYICQFTDDAVTLYDIADGAKCATKALPAGWAISAQAVTVNVRLAGVRARSG